MLIRLAFYLFCQKKYLHRMYVVFMHICVCVGGGCNDGAKKNAYGAI